MFSFHSERLNFPYCFCMRVCVGDNTRAGVIMDHYLSYKIKFLYGQSTKESPNRIISGVSFFSALRIFDNLIIIVHICLNFILHSLTTRLAVHLGKSESVFV